MAAKPSVNNFEQIDIKYKCVREGNVTYENIFTQKEQGKGIRALVRRTWMRFEIRRPRLDRSYEL